MGIPDHLTCLLRNLSAAQEATVGTGHGKTGWFQIRKGARQGCILSPCLFNLCAEYIMRNAGLDEAQAGIKIASRNISKLSSVQFSPVAWSCPTLCDTMNRSMPGLPVHHHLPEFTQTHIIKSVMPSSHLILCRPLLLPPIPPTIKVFSNESTLHMPTSTGSCKKQESSREKHLFLVY